MHFCDDPDSENNRKPTGQPYENKSTTIGKPKEAHVVYGAAFAERRTAGKNVRGKEKKRMRKKRNPY